MTLADRFGWTFNKRLGVVNNFDTKYKRKYPGIYIGGKYWWTIGKHRPIVAVMPDQWEDDFSSGDKMVPLPLGVIIGMGPGNEMVVLK